MQFLFNAFRFEVGKLLLNLLVGHVRTLYKVSALKYNLSLPEIVICCGSLTLFTSCFEMNENLIEKTEDLKTFQDLCPPFLLNR